MTAADSAAVPPARQKALCARLSIPRYALDESHGSTAQSPVARVDRLRRSQVQLPLPPPLPTTSWPSRFVPSTDNPRLAAADSQHSSPSTQKKQAPRLPPAAPYRRAPPSEPPAETNRQNNVPATFASRCRRPKSTPHSTALLPSTRLLDPAFARFCSGPYPEPISGRTQVVALKGGARLASPVAPPRAFLRACSGCCVL
ncbi:hypothetical protein BDK51DRAFT_36604 [Blyttiomyces helicus]|uniref:Uncharacterized protein n=1 Tax=Blyttiomyces helicus TaxID=388810 RepID=A0A4P9W4B8_9FUNG|nr:hypothetical protein BDK51DRAFT_36604 [Blyttiomyces helicus]|eukprot:RKO87191.1 hypothetical protein BDK51DRAFT_36604 [Blyttiomyces helicus]